MTNTKSMIKASPNSVTYPIPLTKKLSKKEREELRKRFADAYIKFSKLKNKDKVEKFNIGKLVIDKSEKGTK